MHINLASEAIEQKLLKAIKTLEIQITTAISFEIIEEYPYKYQSYL